MVNRPIVQLAEALTHIIIFAFQLTMRTAWFLAIWWLSSILVHSEDGDQTAVKLYGQVGLALVPPLNDVLLQMATQEVPMTISFKLSGQSEPQTDACYEDAEGHLDNLLALTVKKQLEIELEPYKMVLKIKSLFPNVTTTDAVNRVNAIKLDASSWTRGFNKAVTGSQNAEEVRDEPWKASEVSTTMKTSVMLPSTSKIYTVKTTTEVTQSSWEGPYYHSKDDFLLEYGDVEKDYEGLQRSDYSENECCNTARCLCDSVPTEENFRIKVYAAVESIEVSVQGLGFEVDVELLHEDGGSVIVYDAEHGSMIVRLEDTTAKNAFAIKDTLIVEVGSIFLRYLDATVMVLQCPSCEVEAQVRILKKSHRWTRSVVSWIFGLEDKADFDRKMKNFEEQQATWINQVKIQEDTDQLNIQNIRVHEQSLASNMVHLRDQICQLKATEMTEIRDLAVNGHSRRIVERVLSVVRSCQYGQQAPKEILSEEKWRHLCKASFKKCEGNFLPIFISQVSCRVIGVVITTDSLVLDMVITVPMGPGINYSASEIRTVPVFNNNTSKILKTEPGSILIRTSEGHSTVLVNCHKHAFFKICPIENADELYTSCLDDVLQKKQPAPACFNTLSRHSSEPQCRVTQTPAGLLVSTEIELQTSSASTILHGFSGSKSSQKVPPGVTFVGHKPEVTKLKCLDMEFQTMSVGDAIDIVVEDLVEEDPILMTKSKNSTKFGWKDISMDSILTRLSNSIDAMNDDPTVKPIFTKSRSILIMVISSIIVVAVVIIIVSCWCGQKFLSCFQCCRQVFDCCCCRQQQPQLQFTPGMRMSTLERQSNRV